MDKMKLFLSLSLMIAATLFTNSSYAQFTIPDETKKEETAPTISAVEVEHSPTGLTYTNDAKLRFERIERRKARNSVDFTNKILMSQTSYKNWASGGQNYLNAKVTSYLNHSYTNPDNTKFNVQNKWDAALGTQTIEDSETGKNSLWKNEDKFQIINMINYQLYEKLYYNFSSDFSSQFTNGYSQSVEKGDPISGFLSPATLKLSLGINFKLDDSRSIVLSPITGNMSIVTDTSLTTTYGLTEGKKTLSNVGMQLTVLWTQPLIKDKTTNTTVLSYRTNTQVYYKYGKNSDGTSSTPTLNWQSWVDYTILKYLSLNFNCQLIYNKAITPTEGSSSHWQFMEVMSLGVTYTFKNK